MNERIISEHKKVSTSTLQHFEWHQEFNLNYMCIYILYYYLTFYLIIRDIKSNETPKLNTPIFTY